MTDQVGSVDSGMPQGEQVAQQTNEQQAPQQEAWYSGFEDPNVKDWVMASGVKSPEAAAQKAWHLEKLLGADKAGRGLVVPKDDAEPEKWGEFYNQLGRPKEPSEYELPVPEGMDGSLAEQFAPVFHDIGLSKKQAHGLTEKWNEYVQGMHQQQEAHEVEQAAHQYEALKGEWGQAFKQNSEIALRAIRNAGLSQEQAVAIEKAIGVDTAAKVFHALGRNLMEDAPQGFGDSANGFGVRTPDEARAEIKRLQNDKDFIAKYLDGDSAAVRKMETLHRQVASS